MHDIMVHDLGMTATEALADRQLFNPTPGGKDEATNCVISPLD